METKSVKLKKKEFFTELREDLITLNLNNQDIGDISEIIGLHALTDLQHLKLRKNIILKINGLDSLVNLQKLDLGENKIIEIDGLSNLINLKQLTLGLNEITEINGLENLKKLQYLSLRSNFISVIGGLNKLKNLKIIDLSSNNIMENEINSAEISKIKKLNNLEEFHLYNNPISIKKKPLKKNRRKTIEAIVNKEGIVSIENLVEQFNVSRMTIHRDLKYLEEKSRIIKIHGGARRLDISPDPLYVKFRKILSISVEISTNWVAENLELTKNELLDKLIEWSELTSFKIKGEMIIATEILK